MLEILTAPDPRLRRVAERVEVFDDALREQFDALHALMLAGPGGVGIAAPQAGINRRLVIVDCQKSLRPCKNHGLLKMCNPRLLESSGQVLGREGCLSVPAWVGMVSRAKAVVVEFQDEFGCLQQLQSSGFEARVIQHEIDHLDGVLFTDRVVSTHDLVRRMAAQ